MTNSKSASLVAALDVTSLKAELHGLIEPQLQDMSTFQSKMEESVQGMLMCLWRLMERVKGPYGT